MMHDAHDASLLGWDRVTAGFLLKKPAAGFFAERLGLSCSICICTYIYIYIYGSGSKTLAL